AWVELARVMAYEYEGPNCVPLRAERFGVDTGGHHTGHAYRFAHRMGAQALKGKPNDPDAPPLTIGNPGKVRDETGKVVARVPLHLVGTFLLKKRVYFGLHQAALTAESGELEPAALFLPPDSSDADYQQITAEYLVEDVKRGRRVSSWECAKTQPNE